MDPLEHDKMMAKYERIGAIVKIIFTAVVTFCVLFLTIVTFLTFVWGVK